MHQSNPGSSRLFIAVIIILPFLLFWRWLLKGEVLFWGTSLLQFWPWHSLVKTALLAGEWPLWNPLLGNGAPLLANLQTALFYPPNLLYLLLPIEHGLTLSVLLHLLLAGFCMYGYARQIELNSFAATLAALTYMLSGYLVGRTQFVTMINAAAWLPLLLLLSEKLVTRPTYLHLIGLGLALAIQLLAGHAQLWFYSLWLVGPYAIFRAWQEARPPEIDGLKRGRMVQRWLAIGQTGWRLGLAVGLASLLAAVQILPTAEFTSQSPRGSGAERIFALTYSFWPWRLVTLLAPDFFGHPARGNFWGYANYWEDHAYLGVIPFLLAVTTVWNYGIYRLWQRYYQADKGLKSPQALPELAQPWRIVPFFAVLIPVSLLLAMGWNTPLYIWVFNLIPGFNFFQAPARLLIWYTVAMAVLAGVGAQFFQLTPASRRSWRRLLVASIGVTIAGLAGSSVVSGRSQTFLVAMVTLGIWLTFSITLLLLKPRFGTITPRTVQPVSAGSATPTKRPDIPQASIPGQVYLWQGALIALVALDLLLAALPLNPTLPATIFHQPIASAAALQAQPGPYRFFVAEEFDYAIKFEQYFRFETFGPLELVYWQDLKETLVPNLGVYAGLSSANNYDPLVVGRWQQLVNLIKDADEGRRARLLSLMSVGYFIDSAGRRVGPELYNDGTITIQAVPEPLPRAYFVPRASWAADEAEVQARLISANFDSSQEVVIMMGVDQTAVRPAGQVLDHSSDPTGSLAGTPGIPNLDQPVARVPVTVREQSPNRVGLSLEAPAPGFVVLTDTFYPGWRATIDGQPAHIWPANLAFQAVAIEAGSHEVVFSYQPGSFTVGLWLSIGALLVTVLSGGFLLKNRSRSVE